MKNNFLDSLLTYAHDYQTGCLKVCTPKSQQQPWYLYFRIGRLFWAAGGEHEQRRVYRQLLKHFPKETQQLLLLDQAVHWNSSGPYYSFLASLYKQERISIEQFIAMKNEIMLEVLFDILQADHLDAHEEKLVWEFQKNCRPENYVAVDRKLSKSTEELVKEAWSQWKTWEQANLTNYSPNQAPIILNQEQIKQTTAERTFHNLQRLITGKQSLRDLTIATQSNMISVTKALWRYYEQGWLDFKTLPDLDWQAIAPKTQYQPSETTKLQVLSNAGEGKLCVACIDDSLMVIEVLRDIVHERGHSFVGINDPLQANMTLLKARPDLIFLDLIMPHADGYEVCTQLRKIGSLKEIPIVILTGKDGLIDRMRAKMVGANEYVSKPIQRKEILTLMQKYLSNPTQNSNYVTSSMAYSYQPN